MRWSGATILTILVLLPATTQAQVPASWTVAGGPGLVLSEDGPMIVHFRVGREWVPVRGLGFGLDGGWLCAGMTPTAGVGTVSPTFVYSLGGERRTVVSLRAGYTFVVGEREPVVHGGITFDQALGRGGRLRLEVRDNVFLGHSQAHALEVALGWVTP